jgi:hypothetical protein
MRPEQVQDFYPTPGTVSTCMFHTGLDPYTMESVYVPKTHEEKAEQRALLQYFRPENRDIVLKALKKAGRYDLIGNGKNCLVADDNSSFNKPFSQSKPMGKKPEAKKAAGKNPVNNGKKPIGKAPANNGKKPFSSNKKGGKR